MKKLMMIVIMVSCVHFFTGCRSVSDERYYPYTDEEYLGINDSDDYSTDIELEDQLSRMIVSAGCDDYNTEDYNIYIDESQLKLLKNVSHRGNSDNSFDLDDFHVAYIKSKVYKDKAVIAFEANYSNEEYKVSEENPITDNQTYNPDKLYLTKEDGKWKIEKVFLLP